MVTKLSKTSILILVFIMFFAGKVFAGNNEDGSINWFFLGIGLLGGLALFLYGMDKMSSGLKKSAGNRMRKILATLTNNRFIGLFVGAFVTMVIQSSSATTVMLVSFVQSGLMSFVQSLGVILGANIGTTFTAQLIAFKLTDYAVLMIALGFAFSIFSKKDTLKNIGDTILGFGLLFYGIKLMSNSMEPLRTYSEFIDLLKNLENPLAGIIVGMVFTALIQSSSAFTGIVIVLAQQNLISLEAGIPMIIGANIGTCITAGLASFGTNREAKRVAFAHSFLNIGGALAFVFWIPYFADLVKMIGGEEARQIANAHTIFNVGTALIFIPFTGITAVLINKILPDKLVTTTHLVTKYLDKKMLQNPALAIDLVVAEIGRAVNIIIRMLEAVIIPFVEKVLPKDKYHPELGLMEALDMREEEIDYLDSEITEYIMQLSRKELETERVAEIFALLSVINDLENISDIIHREILPLIEKKRDLNTDFSKEGRKELLNYHEKVLKQMYRLEKVFKKRDALKAIKILVKGEKYTVLETKYMNRHFKRIKHKVDKSVITHKVHSDLFDALRQITMYLENIAGTVADASPFEYAENE
ncbi:MAG: Na/Pi cotransporter family protein [Bacteroidales bacterium]|nr:Na/Pi cotransporter family protein [Bacteroidales bacterium]